MKTNESLLIERNKHIPQGLFNVHPIFVERAKGAVSLMLKGKNISTLPEVLV